MSDGVRQGTRGLQIIYRFDDGRDACSPRLRGSKGAGLARMSALGLPIPPGFTISTAVGRAGMGAGGGLPRRLRRELPEAMAALERQAGRWFGDPQQPLLVSVRSGAAVSMPGMMDTVLNVGMTPAVVEGLARQSGRRFAYDCYRRFLGMFGEIVLGVDRSRFAAAGADAATCRAFRQAIEKATGTPVPDDPWQQLNLAIRAVLKSWDNPRAQLYRAIHRIPERLGTAITVQAMVFGNRGEASGTGVVFSRRPDTGTAEITGEFLPDAQGEEVVSGTATPMPVARMSAWNPAVYRDLVHHVTMLERDYGQTVEVEFTVEQGRLFLLQCRAAALSPEAAAIAAVHDVCRRRLTRRQAVERLTGDQLRRLGRPLAFAEEDLHAALATRLLGQGLPAAPGAAVGRLALTGSRAEAMAQAGDDVVLLRPDTDPNDLAGMLAATVVVTAAGGTTSHAAVVARALGIPAVVGVAALAPGHPIHDGLCEGEVVAVDGTHGLVIRGPVPLAAVPLRREVRLLLHWAQRYRPQPRLGAAWAAHRVAVNDLLCDVYLSEAMALASRGTVLEAETDRLRREVHGRCAEIFAAYLTIAVVVELNQSEAYGAARYQAPDELAALDATYRAFGGSWTAPAVLARLAAMPHGQQAAFFRHVAAVFRKGWWEPGYGGPAWSLIAEAVEQYLTGRISPTVFVDTVFHLRHHGRRLFDKHPMVRNELSDETLLQAQLNGKTATATPEALFLQVCRPPAGVPLRYGPSAAVLAVWQRGVVLGLWRSPDATARIAAAPVLVPA